MKKGNLTRVPSFLTSQDAENKSRLMKQYKQWKNWEAAELMKKYYREKLEKLVLIDEQETLVSKFLSNFNRAERLGLRKAYRAILKDLD